ncbi:MAG: dTDP-4-dehydrorhamnose reductase [Kiritimatiellae bacterium]|nr:dTDP-4-dehydrorhamnose reductase [Kiritimatiellia bacterium]
MNTTIAITGGRGMLGSDLAAVLEKAGYQTRALDLPDFDLADPVRLKQGLDGVEIVVNCAAFTNVDQAEDAPETAMHINAEAVGNLGVWAKERNAYLIHISTDFVFDGESARPYLETDMPRPINVYGQSKLKGEELLRQSGCRCAIVRVQWSYGKHGVNFVAKLLERSRGGGALKVVNDQTGAPTWTLDMARAINSLLRERPEGIFHFANAGYATRYETAMFIARKMRLPNPIKPCASSEFPAKARRPKNSRFCTDKIQALLDHEIRSWEEALDAFLQNRAS